MSTSKPRSINGLFLLVAVLGLVFGSAGPAAATHYTVEGGSSVDYGEEWGPSHDQLCSDSNQQFLGAQFETTYYLITSEPFIFLVNDTAVPTAYYGGTLTMNIQHGDMVSGPQGAQPGECTGSAVVPTTIGLTKATVLGNSSGPSGSGSVNCQMINENGSYFRVESDFRMEFDLSCTVKGNSYGLTSTRVGVWTTFVLAGTQNMSGYLDVDATTVAISPNGHA